MGEKPKNGLLNLRIQVYGINNLGVGMGFCD